MKNDMCNGEIEDAYQKLISSSVEIIKDKLREFKDNKWIFKGWIMYGIPDIRFEMKYYDKNSDEKLEISGYCTISDGFSIETTYFDFLVLKENTEQYLHFKICIDDNELLLSIEEHIRAILKDNRSYRYFIEDYQRYMKTSPLRYIYSLLNNNMLAMEESVEEEETGRLLHYTGEYGEDFIEIILDDRDISIEGSRKDSININVCDRFYCNISHIKSQDIRNLIPLIRPIIISVEDFLIITSTKHCLNREHNLQRIKALVCIDDGRFVKEVLAEAMFCEECKQYFISELEYDKLCKQGRVCSRVITIAEYKKIIDTGFYSWAQKSLLRSYGYTVNSQEGLSDVERHRILSFVIENEIMKIDEIISFIEWLIRRNSGKNLYNAIAKWNKDISFVRNYKPIKGIVKVKDIYKKKYVNT